MLKETKQALRSGPGYQQLPNHHVEMQPYAGRVTVNAAGFLLADSFHAILLTETGYSPVYYLPCSDVDFSKLESLELSTYCPFKGQARYWRLADADEGAPIAWGYDEPYSEVYSLLNYVAFYEDRVVVEAEKTA